MRKTRGITCSASDGGRTAMWLMGCAAGGAEEAARPAAAAAAACTAACAIDDAGNGGRASSALTCLSIGSAGATAPDAGRACTFSPRNKISLLTAPHQM
jgi:hypothetical protein